MVNIHLANGKDLYILLFFFEYKDPKNAKFKADKTKLFLLLINLLIFLINFIF